VVTFVDELASLNDREERVQWRKGQRRVAGEMCPGNAANHIGIGTLGRLGHWRVQVAVLGLVRQVVLVKLAS